MSHPEADHLPIEQRALGAMLCADDAVAIVRDAGAQIDYFTDPVHRVIFSAALQVAADDEHGRVDSLGVLEFLQHTGQDESCGGFDHLSDYLTQLGGCVITARNFGKDIERLRGHWQRRQVLDKLAQAGAQLRGGSDPVEAIRAASDLLLDLRADFEAKAGASPFEVVPIADLASARPEPTAYWWDGRVPAGAVTLWSGHGGSVKSFVGLMLGAALATNRPLFGVPTRSARVAFYSAEDPPSVTRYRLQLICRHLDIDPAELADRLRLLDASTADPALFRELQTKAGKQGVTTAAFEALRAYLQAECIDVLMVDNASDTYDASEIERARVRGFMRALQRLVPSDGAVILLAHVDKATSRGDRGTGEAYSGSTAWHNSARSRIAQSVDKDGGILLEHQKNNYGPKAAPLRLTWPAGGVPQLDAPVSGVVQHITDRNDTKAVLALIHEFNGRTDYINTATTGRANAAVVLAREPNYPGLKAADLFDLLRRAERAGHLVRVDYKNADRKDRQRWEVTTAGQQFAGLAPNAPNAPNSRQTDIGAIGAEGAPNAPNSARGVRGDGAHAEIGAEATP